MNNVLFEFYHETNNNMLYVSSNIIPYVYSKQGSIYRDYLNFKYELVNINYDEFYNVLMLNSKHDNDLIRVFCQQMLLSWQ